MTSKFAFEAVNHLFKNLCDVNNIFGGKFILVSKIFDKHYQYADMVVELKSLKIQ